MPRSTLITERTLLILLALLLTTACEPKTATETHTADTRAADESTLKNLDNEWSKAASAKDADKTASYYSDDAQVLPPNSPVIHGKAGARAMWQSMFNTPGFGGGWKATKAEVAKSGDLGYTSGTYEMNETDAAGKPKTDKGKYLAVWKKQADGNWKCVVDMFSSDLPIAGAPPTVEKKETAAKK